MIPVSTLVSGIDNGAVHLGPLKLAWHFKGGGRGAGAASSWGCVGGVGEKVFLACDETEYVLGSDLEHCGIVYKYGAYGTEPF